MRCALPIALYELALLLGAPPGSPGPFTAGR